MIGFSAGGHLAAAISSDWRAHSYRRVDAADDLSARPDFAIGVYPGHLWEEDTAHEGSDHRMAAARGAVAGDDRRAPQIASIALNDPVLRSSRPQHAD